MTTVPPFRLDGKTAIVTGAGSGIGAAIAELFARQGARVMVLEIDRAKAMGTVDRIRAAGGTAEGFACDIGDAAAVATAFAAVRAVSSKLDILVNNAGVSAVGTIENTSEADLDRVYRVNIKGAFLCSKAAVPWFLAGGGGVICNLASIASLIGIEERFAYGMSKGAVLTMTKSIAIDYVKKGIRCNCICPARVHTPFVDGFLAKNYPGREAEKFKELSAYQPIGRMGKPEEVAALALYLCSDEAGFVTGQAYPLDGGVLR